MALSLEQYPRYPSEAEEEEDDDRTTKYTLTKR